MGDLSSPRLGIGLGEWAGKGGAARRWTTVHRKPDNVDSYRALLVSRACRRATVPLSCYALSKGGEGLCIVFGGNTELGPPVIARSASDEAIPICASGGCFADARNDRVGQVATEMYTLPRRGLRCRLRRDVVRYVQEDY